MYSTYIGNEKPRYKLPGFKPEPLLFGRGGEVPAGLRLKNGGLVSKIFNKKPRDLTMGGEIKRTKGMTKRHLAGDSVKTYLQPNTLVLSLHSYLYCPQNQFSSQKCQR